MSIAVAVSAIAALNVEAATVTESEPVAVSAMLAPNVDALTATESAPVANSAMAAPKIDAATLTVSAPVAASVMLVLKVGTATNVSDMFAVSSIYTLNEFDPVAANGAAAKADPQNINYPIKQHLS